MELNEIRKEIDSVNTEIVELFTKRMNLVREVAVYKKERNMPILDKDREDELISDILEKAKPEYREYVKQFLLDLLSVSRKMQHDIISGEAEAARGNEASEAMPQVAYLGIPGSFSEQAVVEYFKDDVIPVSVKSFEEIIAKVENETYDMAVIPVENSSTGSVNQSIDFLTKHDINIIGEHIIKVRHFLLGVDGSSLGQVDKALSHPQALEQCDTFLQENRIFAVPVKSTADAAEEVAKKRDKTLAAISSKRASKLYGLKVIAEDIQSNNSNYTRFVVISKKDINVEDADKISLICSIEHKPGTLFHLLDIFSRHQINLLQLFSRPIPNVPWQYRFHLDFSGNLKSENVQAALSEAQKYCTEIKILGNYRSYKNG